MRNFFTNYIELNINTRRGVVFEKESVKQNVKTGF